jgi:sugar lactone lactonase YvrE
MHWVLACVLAASSAAQSAKYVVDPAWPKRPAEAAWGEMPGVAVDREDRVWIYTRAKPAIQVYAADGTYVKGLDIEHKRAHHIKVDVDGNVWAAEVGLHVVRKYGPDGKVLLTLGTPGEAGTDERHFNEPTDMTVTPAGDIFVSDGYKNTRVVHFGRDGKFVKAWGKKGTGPGEFDLPHGIGVDSKGRIYVADRSNGRIQVFEQSGKFLAQWADAMVPWSIWITAKDEIWSCGSTSTTKRDERGMLGIPPHDQLLVKFDASGKVLERIAVPLGVKEAVKPGDLCWVHAVAPDSKGNLYAGDIQGRRVQKFVPKR